MMSYWQRSHVVTRRTYGMLEVLWSATGVRQGLPLFALACQRTPTKLS